MASAYRYADGGGLAPLSSELLILRRIERYGVMAVMGRPVLGANEMRRLELAENVLRAYQSREASTDWAAWARDNEGAATLLDRAIKAVNNGF